MAPTDEPPASNGKTGATLAQQDHGDTTYLGPPFLLTERHRLEAVSCCMPVDADEEERFSQVCDLVATVLGTPTAGVSIIGADSVLTKGLHGIEQPGPSLRRFNLCTWTLLPLNPEALVLEDMSEDARFKDHMYVKGPPYFRSYLGAPLVTSTGFRLGTVCALDFKPQSFGAAAVSWMCNMAELVVQEIESTLITPLPGPRMFRQQHNSFQPVLVLNMREQGWKILYKTKLWPSTASASRSSSKAPAVLGSAFWDLYAPMTALPPKLGRPVWHQYNSLIRKGQCFQLVVRDKLNPEQLLCLDMRPGSATKVWDDAVDVIVSSVNPINEAEHKGINGRHLYFAVLLNNEVMSTGATSCCGPGGSRTRASSPFPPTSAGLTAAASGASAGEGDEQRSSLQSSSLNSFSSDEGGGLWQPTPFTDVQMGPLLGQGAYGRVYLGIMGTNPVAIKIIPQQAGSNGGGQPQGEQHNPTVEGAVGLKLSHQNVVRTHQWLVSHHTDADAQSKNSKRRRLNGVTFGGVSAAKDHIWILLEYCDRGTLQAAIDKGVFRSECSTFTGGVNMAAILNIALDIAKGMEYLHAQGVLHGDLGPKNVLMTRDESRKDPPLKAKVSDFGLALEYDQNAGSIATHNYGTVTHMPPELVTQGRLTRSADVYAFGVLLWELYTGQRPFAGYNPVQLIAQRLLGNLQLTFEDPVPGPYRALVERCLADEPSQRPTFPELVSSLQQLQEQLQKGQLESAGDFPVWKDTSKQFESVVQELAPSGLQLYMTKPCEAAAAKADSPQENGPFHGQP